MGMDMLEYLSNCSIPSYHIVYCFTASLLLYWQFWRKKKSMAGMSVRSLGINCFFQVTAVSGLN
jgi:hypothetical protein